MVQIQHSNGSEITNSELQNVRSDIWQYFVNRLNVKCFIFGRFYISFIHLPFVCRSVQNVANIEVERIKKQIRRKKERKEKHCTAISRLNENTKVQVNRF